MATHRATAQLPPRYEVVRHLADGGMASVFEARDTLLDRPVAVKVLSDALSADDAARRRFTREARAAARLSTHPHVVTVFDAGEHDGAAFLVMAYYPGGSVGARLRRGRAPEPDTALRWLAEAAGALDFAHAHGVVHRDVKPDNLLLDASDRTAVGDFGIATAAWDSSLTSTGLVLGTTAYLSPEQRVGDPATPASDRYALALVAHELLTGVRRGSAESGRPLGPRTADALRVGVAEAPDARPRSAAALVESLEDALAADGDAELPPTAATQVAPRPRPRATPVPVPVPVPVAAEPPTRARVPREPSGTRSAPVAPAPPPSDDDEPRRRGRGGLIAAGVAVVAVLGGAAAIATSGGGDDGDRAAATTTRSTRTTTRARSTASAPATTPAPAAVAPTTQAAPAATTQAAPAATTAGDASGMSQAQLTALNDRGYALTNQGSASAAVPLLRTAVAGLCADETQLPCAFSLFNLGRALRLSGSPAEAIPYLQRRLSVSDYKVAEVRAELARAQAAAGGTSSGDDAAEATPAPAASPGADANPGKGNGGKAKGLAKQALKGAGGPG